MYKLKVLALLVGLLWPLQAQADEFPYLVMAYYQVAERCIKPETIPTLPQIRRITESLQEAAERWWPDNQEEALLYLFALGISEGQGDVDGKEKDPDEPSYGFFHIKESTARYAIKYYGVQPYCKWIPSPEWFRSALKTNIRAGILAGAANARIMYREHDGDWMRVVLNHKYGDTGLKRVIYSLGDKPLSSLPKWRHYCKIKKCILCMQGKLRKLDSNFCSCVNVFHTTRKP